ncbi:hypothetical protein A2U01_0056187, partial [Trifolium medium]|nr:hypothetical protein [Trifolium medium]
QNSQKQIETSDGWEQVELTDDIAQDETTEQENDVDMDGGVGNTQNEEENVVIEDTSSESERSTPLQARIRKPSVRLNDYVTGREAEEDEELHNLAVFNTNEDPITYHDAVKFEVWRKAMNAEMESIKNNDTWELTSLP